MNLKITGHFNVSKLVVSMNKIFFLGGGGGGGGHAELKHIT